MKPRFPSLSEAISMREEIVHIDRTLQTIGLHNNNIRSALCRVRLKQSQKVTTQDFVKASKIMGESVKSIPLQMATI